MQSVESLVARGQRLVDSGPPRDPIAWYIEAAYIGDLSALGTAATIASRGEPQAH